MSDKRSAKIPHEGNIFIEWLSLEIIENVRDA